MTLLAKICLFFAGFCFMLIEKESPWRIWDASSKCSESELDNGLKEMISNFSYEWNTKRVIGLDMERSYGADKVVLLKLSTGCFCLLIRLCHIRKRSLNALANLLELPDVSFVGVGIKFCLDLLDKDYGLKCRNHVDLGQLAAAKSTTRNDKLLVGYCGLADLAEAVCYVTLNVKAFSVVSSDWAAANLSEDQVETATTDAFVSFLVGNRLLGGSDPPKGSIDNGDDEENKD